MDDNLFRPGELDPSVFDHGSFGHAARLIMEDWSCPKMKKRTRYNAAQALAVILGREHSIVSTFGPNYIWWSPTLDETGSYDLFTRDYRQPTWVRKLDRDGHYRINLLDTMLENASMWSLLFPDDFELWACDVDEEQIASVVLKKGLQLSQFYLSRVVLGASGGTGAWGDYDDYEEYVDSSEIIFSTRPRCINLYIPLQINVRNETKGIEVAY